MRRNTKPLTISGVIRRELKTDPKPAYQTGPRWSVKQKQLLIDSILRDLDIPKFYLRVLKNAEFEYEVVDGQQRLRAIWEFVHNKYKLDANADVLDDGKEIAGLYYDQFSDDLKDQFNEYQLDIVELHDASLEDVEEMFLRLQNGTTLKAAEKRNALPGKMKYFIRKIAEHKFFTHCGFENKRFQFQQVAAQMMCLELNGGPCNVKNTELEKMYLENLEFDENSLEAKKIQKVLNFLNEAFPEKMPELSPYNANSLYILASILLENYAVRGSEKNFNNWFLNFETKRRSEMQLPEDERDNEMVSYQNQTSHATDSVDSLEYRHKILAREFFEAFPDIAPLDKQRGFTFEQKLAIFRRDHGIW
jgi:transcriptional regulator with XRE-family HTH domain